MRFVLGCLGVVFVIFGGCVLAIFSQGVAGDEVALAIGALFILSFGIWTIYKAITMKRARAGGDRDRPGFGPPQP